MDKIAMDFTKNNSELDTTSQRVTEMMENNADFPNAPAALAELKKLLPEYRTAKANAQGRDKRMVSIKNDKKAIMVALLLELAEYVTATCNGNRTMILSSGFDVINERTGSPVPSIEKLEVKSDEPGVAILRAKMVTAVKAYIHQDTTELPGLNTVWVQEGSSDGNHTFTGLASEKRHWFRIVAIGNNKQKAFSPIVSKVIQ